MAADEAYADVPVIGLLLDQFRTRANARAEAADLQALGDGSRDTGWKEVLEGLTAAARHAAQPLVEVLLAWRKTGLAQAQQFGSDFGPPSGLVLRKRLAVEAIFLEAALAVLRQGADKLTDRQAAALEGLAFDWIVNAERYIESRFHELLKCRDKMVVESCAVMLGALSEQRLMPIVTRLLREMCDPPGPGKVGRLRSDAPSARQEIFQMCRGMKRVRLPLGNANQIRQAVEVLEKLNPLKHVATVRKSQVQHALAEMLTSMLAHSVAVDEPRALAGQLDVNSLALWYQSVALLRAAVAGWQSKGSKHMAVTLPLQTQLLCLDSDSAFLHGINSLVDNLSKQLRGDFTGLLHSLNPLGETEKKASKDRSVKTSAVSCLAQCITTYLRRFAPSTANPDLLKWLKRAMAGILTQLKKASFPAADQQVLIQQLLVDISQHVPAFALETLAVQVLNEPTNLEMSTIGLRSLRAVVLSPPTYNRAKEQPELSDVDQATASAQLLEFMRSGGRPLEAHAATQLEDCLAAQMDKAMKFYFGVFGSLTLVSGSRGLADLGARDKYAGLPAACAAGLRCVPFVVPAQWAASPEQMAEELAAYSINLEASIRKESVAAMKRILHAMPAARSAVVAGLAGAYAGLSDDFPEVLWRVAGTLVDLMDEWRGLLLSDAASRAQAPEAAGPVDMDIARVEGFAISILCHPDVHVRQAGIKVLFAARSLHQALQEAGGNAIAGNAGAAPVPSTPGVGTPRSTLGPGSPLDDSRGAYIADVVDQLGDDIAARCWWDIEPWAAMRQQLAAAAGQPSPTPMSFTRIMTQAAAAEDNVRWSRVLAGLAHSATTLCPASCRHGCEYIGDRLQNVLGRDGSARPTLPVGELATDRDRLNLARAFAVVVTACHRYSGRKSSNFGSKDVIRMLFTSIRVGGEAQQAAAVLALGHCSLDNCVLLPEELKALKEECTADRKSKQTRMRHSEIKVAIAHVLRLLVGSLPPGALRTDAELRTMVLDQISSTYRHLTTVASEVSAELQQLRLCLAVLAQAAAVQLAEAMPAAFPAGMRSQLFSLFSEWSMDASPGMRTGSYRAEVRRGILAAVARVKEGDAQRALEQELLTSMELLEHAAHSAMAALLLGPAFGGEARTLQGKPLAWVHRMLAARSTSAQADSLADVQPQKLSLAIRALGNLLRGNADAVSELFIDQCYSANAAIAHAYFQAVLEVYATHDIDIRPHVLLALVLYKVVDQEQSVREDSLHLLELLSERFWRSAVTPRTPDGGMTPAGGSGIWALPVETADSATAGGSLPQVLVGSLQESYHRFQLALSSQLAREHPEMTELLCVEVMTRQLHASAVVHQHAVLAALAPWMDNLSFAARWEGNWSERLLKSMYYVTLRHANAFPRQVELLWTNVALNRRNVVPVLDFLIARGHQECNGSSAAQDVKAVEVYLTVAKRIVLYLARAAPQQTIDHLATEAARLLNEAEDPPPAAAAAAAADDHADHVLAFSDEPQWPVPAAPEASPFPEPATSRRPSLSISRASSSISARFVALHTNASGPPELAEYGTSGMPPTPGSAQLRRSSPGGGASFGLDPGTPSSASKPVAEASEPPGRVSRAEVALALVAEATLEHEGPVRAHAPLLAHLALLMGDARRRPADTLAAALAGHLVAALSLPHLQLQRASGGMVAEYEAAAGLLSQLQALGAGPLWPREAVSLACPRTPSEHSIATSVAALLAALPFETGLRTQWAAHALHWALAAKSPHLAARSHQVYRALRPALEQEACARLLEALEVCLQPTASPLADLLVAADIIVTLEELVGATPAGKLMLFPQVFLAAIVLLDLPWVHLHTAALHLFSRVLARMELADPWVHAVLLAAGATRDGGGASGPLLQRSGSQGRAWPLGALLLVRNPAAPPPVAVQQLLVKGLLQPPTQAATIQVLTQLAQHVARGQAAATEAVAQATGPLSVRALAAAPAAGLHPGALLGEPAAQLALSLAAASPWLLAHRANPSAQACLEAHAEAAAALALPQLAEALRRLAGGVAPGQPQAAALLAAPLAAAFFPRFAKAVVQRQMETLARGEDGCRPPALLLLRELFSLQGARLPPPAALDAALLQPLAGLLDGPQAPLALQVMEAMMQYCSGAQRQARPTAGDPAHLSPSRGDTLPAPSKPPPPLDWPSAIEGAAGKDTVAAPAGALSGLVSTWSVDAARAAADGNGGIQEAQAVPQVYRLLDTVGDRAASAASSNSEA